MLLCIFIMLILEIRLSYQLCLWTDWIIKYLYIVYYRFFVYQGASGYLDIVYLSQGIKLFSLSVCSKELSSYVNKYHFAHPLKLSPIYLLRPVHFIIFCLYFDVLSVSYVKNFKIFYGKCWSLIHFIGQKHDKSKTRSPLKISRLG